MSESQLGYGERGMVIEGSYSRCAAALRLLRKLFDAGTHTPEQVCIMHGIEHELIKGAGKVVDSRLESCVAAARDYIATSINTNEKILEQDDRINRPLYKLNSVLRVIDNYLEAGMGGEK